MGTAASQTIRVDNNLNMSNSGLDFAISASTYNPNLDLRGDLTIATQYFKGSGTTTFKKGGTQTFTGNFQDLGAVQVSINGTNTTLNLGSSVWMTSLTIDAQNIPLLQPTIAGTSL